MGEGELSPDEWVSQYVGDPLTGAARNRPRPCDHDGVSVVRGWRTPEELYRMVKRRQARKGIPPSPDDGARYAQVRTLRAAGFIVTLTPTQGNRDHVSIAYSGVWTTEQEATFDNAFCEPVWHEPKRGVTS